LTIEDDDAFEIAEKYYNEGRNEPSIEAEEGI
jgi:hypothetical protein